MSLATWSSPAAGSIWSNGSAESQPSVPDPLIGQSLEVKWAAAGAVAKVVDFLVVFYEHLWANCQLPVCIGDIAAFQNKTKLHFLMLSMKQWLRPCLQSPKSTAWRSILESGTIATELWWFFSEVFLVCSICSIRKLAWWSKLIIIFREGGCDSTTKNVNAGHCLDWLTLYSYAGLR